LNGEDVRQYPDSGLYDIDSLHTLFLEFKEPDWHEEMVAFHGSDIEVPATLSIDGKVLGEVGVSYRGNTSFDMPEKKSFGVSIDAYDDDLRLKGFRTLNLLNANGDPTVMREVLFSNIAGDYMPAPKANFVKVVVNGTYLGVYGNVQQINKDFTKEHYDSKKGVRWKVPPDFSGGSALTYHGEDTAEYLDGYELKTRSADEEDWQDLIELCRVLRTTPDSELKTILPKYLDVDEVIWFLALDNVFMDSDGYYSRGSDYYVYKGPDGIFHLLHYDNNETFGSGGRGGPGGGPGGPPPGGGPGGPPPGGFDPFEPPPGGFDAEEDRRRDIRGRPGLDRPRRGSGADQPRSGPSAVMQDPPERGRGGRGRGGRGRGGPESGINQSPLAYETELEIRPMIVRILAVKEWRELYLERVRELARVELDWEKFGGRIELYRALITEDVVKDPFLGDRETFNRSLDGPDGSLKTIASQRRAFLLAHPSLEVPASD
jgi:hypothetical protein